MFVQFHGAVSIIWEQTFFDVAFEHMTHGSQRLAVQKNTLAQNLQVFLLVEVAFFVTAFIGDAHQIDCADTAGSNGQGCAADGVDERIELRRIGQKPATVGQDANIVAHEEVTVAPLHVML